MKNIVIIGATSSVAQAFARRYPLALFVLVGRSLERLDVVASDLRARGATVETRAMQTVTLDACRALLCDERTRLNGIDLVLIAQGVLVHPDDETSRIQEVFQVNVIDVAQWMYASLEVFKEQTRGKLATDIGAHPVIAQIGFPPDHAVAAGRGHIQAHPADPRPLDPGTRRQLVQRGLQLPEGRRVAFLHPAFDLDRRPGLLGGAIYQNSLDGGASDIEAGEITIGGIHGIFRGFGKRPPPGKPSPAGPFRHAASPARPALSNGVHPPGDFPVLPPNLLATRGRIPSLFRLENRP